MALSRDYVLNSLLTANYFPNQRSSPGELPRTISTVSFTPQVARVLATQSERSIPGYNGYDAVDFKSTRFTGKTRRLSIPHPMAHARLSLCIFDHWDEIKYITYNLNSKIRPKTHRDGRLLVMSYGDWKEKARSRIARALLRKFIVKADVALCFPSIYSHAIAWATVGTQIAKQSVGKKYRHEWFNQLDHCVMMQKRNETSGVLVGPGTSNIAVELILARIDEQLRLKGFSFERYIDDYTAFVDSLEQAEAFLTFLREELRRYKLELNESKTDIQDLPEALIERGVVNLSNLLPKSAAIDTFQAISYLNLSVMVAKENPNFSAIKYALVSLLKKNIAKDAISDILLYALMLSYHQPTLLPLLEMMPKISFLNGIKTHETTLNRMIREYSRLGMADGVVWCIYYLKKARAVIEDDTATDVPPEN